MEVQHLVAMLQKVCFQDFNQYFSEYFFMKRKFYLSPKNADLLKKVKLDFIKSFIYFIFLCTQSPLLHGHSMP